MGYVDFKGNELTKTEIRNGFARGDARIVHGWIEGSVSSSLSLDGDDFDTRDECHSIWEESWTMDPKTVDECFIAAK